MYGLAGLKVTGVSSSDMVVDSIVYFEELTQRNSGLPTP